MTAQKLEAIAINSGEHNPGGVSLDTLGIFASLVCVVHCASMPLIVSLLPLWAPQLESEMTHELLAGVVVAFALGSLLPGYLKHKRNSILVGMVSGLAFVLFASFFADPLLGHSWELPLISIGNLIIIVTHLLNRSICSCKH